MEIITGIIKSVLNADENETLCEFKLSKPSQHCSSIDIHVVIKGIGNIKDQNKISVIISNYKNRTVSAILQRPSGHNKLDIHIQNGE